MAIVRIKPGVRIGGLRAEMTVAVIAAKSIYDALGGYDLTITSGAEGKHQRGSRHYSGCAIDIRAKHLSEHHRAEAERELQLSLGLDYDVVYNSKYKIFHIEYDPKTGINQ